MTDQRATEDVRLGDEEREALAFFWEESDEHFEARVAAVERIIAARLRALTDEGQRAARAEALRTPQEWCDLLGARVVDPDGWRDGTRSWDEPINREEFDRRLIRCTVDGRGYPDFLPPNTVLPGRATESVDRVASGGGQGEEGT